jgi:hypothetical protein
MSATIGKNSDTGMMTLTFESTGRTSQFTKEETIDLEQRLHMIKMEGRMSKEAIGSKAVYALQQLGEAIEDGDPEVISAIWLGTGQKIVEAGVLNNIIQEVKPDNPFSLWMDAPNLTKEDIKRAITVSNKVKEILDRLVEAVDAVKNTDEIPPLLDVASDEMRVFNSQRVGLSDTEARECVANYFKKRLVDIAAAGDAQLISDELFHRL